MQSINLNTTKKTYNYAVDNGDKADPARAMFGFSPPNKSLKTHKKEHGSHDDKYDAYNDV